MTRPLAPAPSAPSPWLTLCYGVIIACIVLGCASINRGVRSAVNPLTDVFSGDKKGAKADKADAQTQAQAQAAAAQSDMFFDTPPGWTITKYVEESNRYQLKHDRVESASLVITTQALTAQDVRGQWEELQRGHDALLNKLTATYPVFDARSKPRDPRPMLYTRLQGSKGDGPEMIIEGYSLAIEGDAFIIFAAYPSENVVLEGDVADVVQSLRPRVTLESGAPDEEDEADAQGEDEADAQVEDEGDAEAPDA